MDTNNIKVIWSADGIPKTDLYRILGDDNFPRDRVAVKLDRLFLTQYGLSTISEVQSQFQVPVFADAKLIEVPSKTLELTKLHLEHQPWMLNVMAGACNTCITPRTPTRNRDINKYDLLYHFAALCVDANTLPCAVTVLTSKTSQAIRQEYQSEHIAVVIKYARLLEECGFTDIVCSPQEANTLVSNQYLLDINTPGIRLPDSSKDDQARISTPHAAFAAGVKRIVVGRDIYRTGAPYTVILPNIEKIFANIEGSDQL